MVTNGITLTTSGVQTIKPSAPAAASPESGEKNTETVLAETLSTPLAIDTKSATKPSATEALALTAVPPSEPGVKTTRVTDAPISGGPEETPRTLGEKTHQVFSFIRDSFTSFGQAPPEESPVETSTTPSPEVLKPLPAEISKVTDNPDVPVMPKAVSAVPSTEAHPEIPDAPTSPGTLQSLSGGPSTDNPPKGTGSPSSLATPQSVPDELPETSSYHTAMPQEAAQQPVPQTVPPPAQQPLPQPVSQPMQQPVPQTFVQPMQQPVPQTFSPPPAENPFIGATVQNQQPIIVILPDQNTAVAIDPVTGQVIQPVAVPMVNPVSNAGWPIDNTVPGWGQPLPPPQPNFIAPAPQLEPLFNQVWQISNMPLPQQPVPGVDWMQQPVIPPMGNPLTEGANLPSWSQGLYSSILQQYFGGMVPQGGSDSTAGLQFTSGF